VAQQPVYPLEASGTSGMKAGMNGVLNLSVLDGWWDEGYDGRNGWAIKPVSEGIDEHRRNAEEAKTLYELLQDHVIPAYYTRNEMGYSPEWVRMAKRSMATLLPRFNSCAWFRSTWATSTCRPRASGAGSARPASRARAGSRNGRRTCGRAGST
jgi:glucan phosphorylase